MDNGIYGAISIGFVAVRFQKVERLRQDLSANELTQPRGHQKPRHLSVQPRAFQSDPCCVRNTLPRLMFDHFELRYP
jgi:hypothetical protein